VIDLYSCRIESLSFLFIDWSYWLLNILELISLLKLNGHPIDPTRTTKPTLFCCKLLLLILILLLLFEPFGLIDLIYVKNNHEPIHWPLLELIQCYLNSEFIDLYSQRMNWLEPELGLINFYWTYTIVLLWTLTIFKENELGLNLTFDQIVIALVFLALAF
jgi:hypothetical protein